MKKGLLIVAVFAFGFVLTFEKEVKHGPGVLAPDDPVQVDIKTAASFPFGEYRIIPLADFSLTARILSKKKYGYGRESDLSPIDLALGWGRMSDETIVESFSISQSGRWYNWRARKLPIPSREVSNHSANMHIIPATDELKKRLMRLKKGEIIQMTGKLVNVQADDGWLWKSSLKRTDRGSGACEIFFVESLTVKEFSV
ncbi:MAG: hypothetical protein BMS9Abin05_0438 [Rhodothermia bacterium]|nr:MAG: hypothetical protein BMS9Abin05_0438 [Rhodothermia bacterium]